MQLGDAIHRGQPQAGALADFLGGEKRIENVAQDLRIHAEARVSDAQADELSHARLRVLLNVLGVNVRGGRADDELSASGHRVASVDGQVDDDLFDHAGVGVNRRELTLEIEIQNNVFAERSFEHGSDIADDFVQVQRALLNDLTAAEGQQLTRQVGRAIGRRGNFLQRFLQLRQDAAFGQQQVRVPFDDRKNIVEIVRDAGGKLADRFHFLGLA